MTPEAIIHNVLATRFIDGDTFEVGCDLRGLLASRNKVEYKIRLAGINCPEIATAEGAAAAAFTMNWLNQGDFDLIVYTRDKYGRLLGDALRASDLLTTNLLVEGYAKRMSLRMQVEAP